MQNGRIIAHTGGFRLQSSSCGLPAPLKVSSPEQSSLELASLKAWRREAVGVVVELDDAGRRGLREQDDLADVIREVLDDVEDGVDDDEVAALDVASLEERFGT